MLAFKLAEFLASSFPYTLSQLSGAAKEHLYKGPPTEGQADGTCCIDILIATPHTLIALGENVAKKKLKDSKADVKPHPLKGGWIITDYLIYDWYVINNFDICTVHVYDIQCLSLLHPTLLYPTHTHTHTTQSR